MCGVFRFVCVFRWFVGLLRVVRSFRAFPATVFRGVLLVRGGFSPPDLLLSVYGKIIDYLRCWVYRKLLIEFCVFLRSEADLIINLSP